MTVLILEEEGSEHNTGFYTLPKNPANTTDVVEKLLGIDGGFIVEPGENPTLDRYSGSFVARFPIKINDTGFTIELSGKTQDIKDIVLAGTQHPFVSSINGVNMAINMHKLSPWFLESKQINWNLIDGDEKKLSTNGAFWDQLRYRIPIYHPLSLNKIH